MTKTRAFNTDLLDPVDRMIILIIYGTCIEKEVTYR